MTVYRLLLLVHVLSAFVFIMAHGISAMAILRLPQERDRNRICFLLELSKWAFLPAMRSLELVMLSGIVMMVMAGWYRDAWVWVSLGLVFAVGALMGKYASAYMGRVRRAMGVPRRPKKGQPMVAPIPANFEELVEVLESGKPKLVASIGLSGLATIVAMMILKPF